MVSSMSTHYQYITMGFKANDMMLAAPLRTAPSLKDPKLSGRTHADETEAHL